MLWLKLLLILVTLNQSIEADNFSMQKCQIHNKAYPFEYLFVYRTYDVYYNRQKRRIFTIPLNLINNFDIIQFKFIQISNNTYYIRNERFNEYVCASENQFFNPSINKINRYGLINDYADSNKRRMIFSVKPSKIDESCEWKLEKIKPFAEFILFGKKIKQKESYRLWNVHYKKPLYAISTYVNGPNLKRAVALWYKKPDSEQFEWYIDCKSGEFLLE